MQMRMYDVKLNDIAKYLTDNLTDQKDNQRMLTNDIHVRVNVKVYFLLSVICQDCINSHGPSDGGNR